MTVTAPRTESFAALGSTIDLILRPWKPQALGLAQAVMKEVDQACSRFRADSDLSSVNMNPDRWVEVGPVLIAALTVALEAAESTDGLVNPCLGRTLRAVGYDADIGIVQVRRDTDASTTQASARLDAWRDVEIDVQGRIRIPDDIELDLGATGKAFAADLTALTIHDELGVDVAVSAGGDVRIVNDTGDPWPIEIAEAPEDRAVSEIAMIEGGIATSSTIGRRWTRGGVIRHHLIDPRTGLPGTGRWRTVTASGPTCVAANVAATAAIILGDEAVSWLNDRQIWARLVDQSGTVTMTESGVAR